MINAIFNDKIAYSPALKNNLAEPSNAILSLDSAFNSAIDSYHNSLLDKKNTIFTLEEYSQISAVIYKFTISYTQLVNAGKKNLKSKECLNQLVTLATQSFERFLNSKMSLFTLTECCKISAIIHKLISAHTKLLKEERSMKPKSSSSVATIIEKATTKISNKSNNVMSEQKLDSEKISSSDILPPIVNSVTIQPNVFLKKQTANIIRKRFKKSKCRK